MLIMFRYLWVWIAILIDLGLFICIFKKLPYAIKHKEVKEFFEGDGGTYIAVHVCILFIASFIYWIITSE